MCENRFGVCYGGSHPEISEGTKRSNDLFHVNVDHSAFYTEALPGAPSAHLLEFGPSRSESKQILVQQTQCASKTLAVDAGGGCRKSSETNIPSPKVFHDHVADPSDILTSEQLIVDLPPEEPVGSHLNPLATSWSPDDNCLVMSTSEAGPTPAVLTEQVTCAAALTRPMTADQFFQCEALGTVVIPSCGGCQCGKCAVPGSLYSYKEQVEFDRIMSNLTYDSDNKRWLTSYPWKSSRSALPRNEKAAFQCLLGLEKRLKNDPELAAEYNNQIQAMVERGAAVLLSEEVRKAWDGDYYYLPIVGVKGKKSLRVCFDASRKQCGCESMNYHLCKGPDRFLNDLLSVLLAFRNGRVGCAGDIRKFHNQVYLVKEDMMMQRFMWRNMETDRKPDHYAVPVNNFGVVSANAIATCALRKTADEFATVYPVESEEVKDQTYIDDQLTAAEDKPAALLKTQRWDEICEHASMPNKGWTFSGDESPDIPIGGEENIDRRLGQSWDPAKDTFSFIATLRVKLRCGGTEEVMISTVAELVEHRDAMMTRRMLLSNVQSIFDPLGLLAPVLLQAKLLLRQTWTAPVQVGWDDPIPDTQADEWMVFLFLLLLWVT